jgi:hypothetical protein
MYRLGNAPIRQFPFPHFYVEEIFAPELFARLRNHLPPIEAYKPIAEGGKVFSTGGSTQDIYPERHIIHFRPDYFERMQAEDRVVWEALAKWLLGPNFLRFLLHRFEELLIQRFGDSLGSIEFQSSAQLLRDFTNYSLGPHADHPSKVIVLLFYLPETDASKHLGTSVYMAHNPEAHDDTGFHFNREDFYRAATMPFKPNCALGFFKTPTSFHGVEHVAGETEQRDLIQFAISHTDRTKS